MADNELAVKITADASEVKEGTEEAKEQIEKAAESVSMLGDFIGVKVPESVQKMLAKSELIGPALEAAFQPLAIIALGQVIADVVVKISELIRSTQELSEEEKKRHDEFMRQSDEELQHEEKIIRGAYELRIAQAETEIDKQAIRVQMAAALVNLDQKHIEELQTEKNHFDDLAGGAKTLARDLHEAASQANYDMEQGADIADLFANRQEQFAEVNTKAAADVQKAIDEANAAMQRHQADQINAARQLNQLSVVALDNLHARSVIAGQLAGQAQEQAKDERDAANALAAMQQWEAKQPEKLLASWEKQARNAEKIDQLTRDVADAQAEHNAKLSVALGYETQEQAAQRALKQVEQDKKTALDDINSRLTAQIAIVKQLGEATMNGLLGSPQQKVAYQKGVTDYQNLKIQELELEKKYDSQIEGLRSKLTDSFIVQLRKQMLVWQDVHKDMESMFMSTLNSMNQNLASFITTGQANWRQLATSAIEEIIKIGLQWAESQITMMILGKTTGKETAGSNIMASAASGAAAAGASVAAIPVVGWSMVEAVSAATYGVLAAYEAGIAGFALGGIVPATGLAFVHQGERILPASMSGTGVGIGGSHTFNLHYHISGLDGADITDTYKSKLRPMIKRDLLKILKKAGGS